MCPCVPSLVRIFLSVPWNLQVAFDPLNQNVEIIALREGAENIHDAGKEVCSSGDRKKRACTVKSQQPHSR